MYEMKYEGVRGDWMPATPATVIRLGLDALFNALDAAHLAVFSVTVTTQFGSPCTYRRKEA